MPAAWGQPNLSFTFNYPSNGGHTEFARLVANSVVLYFPNIPGADVDIGATGFDPSGRTGSGPIPALSYAGVLHLPLSTVAPSIKMPPTPRLTSPQPGASLSVATGKFEFNLAPNNVLDMRLQSSRDGGYEIFEVMSSSGTVSASRLAALGARLSPGAVSATISGVGRIDSLDAMLDDGTLATRDYTVSTTVRLDFVAAP
jgi:hypothetical protein